MLLNTLVYAVWLHPTGVMWLAWTVIVVANVYTLAVLIRPPQPGTAMASAAWTTSTDAMLIVAWLTATGGAGSLFYPLWGVSLIAISFRFGAKATRWATGAYVAAIFHMITHAFFKALLFLGSGSVIEGMHHEQDMRRMGNIRKYMPITAGTFIVGWLAISGVPPFAGFWSKDEILLFAWAESPVLWGIGLVTAILTAFYMSRQVFMVFYGDERFVVDADHDAHASHDEADADADDHAPVAAEEPFVLHEAPHESPWTMTLPLVLLSGAAVVAGVMQLPFGDDWKFLEHWLHPVIGANEAHIDVSDGTTIALVVVAVVCAARLR